MQKKLKICYKCSYIAMKCLVCNKNSYPFCKKCQKNPYRIEDYRNILAEKNHTHMLRKYYNKSLPEIKDLNTPTFWDSKLFVNESLLEQDGMTRERIKTVRSYIHENSKKMLDIGAGHGYLEEYITQKQDHKKMKLYANDFSRQSIKHLKNKYRGEFTVQSIYSLNYPKSFFDTICVLEVLEHIPPSKILQVLRNIRSLLKKNGTLIVSVPINEGLENMNKNKNGHVRTYTLPLITAELGLSGFTVQKSRTIFAFKNKFAIKTFLSKILRTRWKPNNIVVKATAI